ncbi:MAG: hypothetical protein MUC48_23370, partial [Leptolyngbya sp. Prado105]|nr:hypothetical protein [Leptolyngbya sp. Prado105]
MVRRRRKWRKLFACGHRGFGRYCHRCDAFGTHDRIDEPVIVDVVRRVKKRDHSWYQRFDRDPIELRHLPKSIVVKTRRILDLL